MHTPLGTITREPGRQFSAISTKDDQMRATERIEKLEVWHVPISLIRGHTMSFGTVCTADLIVCRAMSSSGMAGWGESTVLAGWCEETAQSAVATCSRALFPALIGKGVFDEDHQALMFQRVHRNYFAKNAVDIALTDLRARLVGLSVASFLGGAKPPASIPLSWSLAGDSVDRDLDEAAQKLSEGFRIFKLKLGAQPVREDLSRVAAVRELVGDDVSIRVDANQGWTRASAAVAIAALNELDVAFIEQPLAAHDTVGAARLQAVSPAPLAADEALETVTDATRLISADAARVFVYKLAKHGGYRNARRVAALAESHGLEGYLGCMIESSLGTAAYLHFAAGVTLQYGCELFGPHLLVDDITHEPVRYSRGAVEPISGMGLGVEVDVEKVARLAQGHSAFTADSTQKTYSFNSNRDRHD